MQILRRLIVGLDMLDLLLVVGLCSLIGGIAR